MWWVLWASLALAGVTREELSGLLTQLEGFYEVGDYEGAAAVSAELAEKTEQLYPGSIASLVNRSSLAFLLGKTGRLDESLTLYRSLADEMEARDDVPEDIEVESLIGWMTVLAERGDVEIVTDVYQQVLRRRKAVGNASRASLEDGLCMLWDELGHPERAVKHCRESVSLAREHLAADDPELGTMLSNAGVAYKHQGDVREARAHYQQAIEHWTALLGPDHPDVAVGLHNLASLLVDLGDADSAEPLFRRALAIDEATWPEGHPRMASTYDGLAAVAELRGDLAQSVALGQQALELRRALLGPHDRQVALSLSNVAVSLGKQGDHGRGAVLLEQALALGQAHLSLNHPLLSRLHHNYATLLSHGGDQQRALVHAELALELCERSLGPDHPACIESTSGLGAIHFLAGDKEQGRRLVREALEKMEAGIELLDALSDREAMEFLPKLQEHLDTWLRLFQQSGEEHEAWLRLRRYKGALVVRARQRRVRLRLHPRLAADLEQVQSLKRLRARMALSVDPDDRARALELRAEQERLERDLSVETPSVEPAPAEALCRVLPDDAALIDIVRTRLEYDFVYVAFVLASDCTLTRVSLGSASTLEPIIAAWRTLASDLGAMEDRTRSRGLAVAEQLLPPLLAATDATHWLVAPDAALSTVPFAALPVASGYLIETHQVTYLDRADDLLSAEREPAPGLLVLGDVDYGNVDNVVLGDCTIDEFGPLPGTAVESAAVSRAWRRSAQRGEPTLVLGGAEASKASLIRGLSAYGTAHLATHGYAVRGACIDGQVEPMMLTGLALSGANPSLVAGGDGLLTAAELSVLNLERMQLLVLSACGTGLGEQKSGRILGLRRAAAVAGVRSLLMTLWSVGDVASSELMTDFYRYHLRRRRPLGPSAALRAAQLDMLARQRAQGVVRVAEWAAFIPAGRP